MDIGKLLFKYRSYTPIPFLIIMLLFSNPNIYSILLGLILVFFGEFIRMWSNSWTGSETRTTSGVGATYLVIKGPYAYVRNPLYLGNIFIYLGLGVMSNALFPYVQIIAVLFFFLQYYLIIKEEEKFLSSKYGNDYQDYFNKVNRFLPKIKKYVNPTPVQPEFSLKKGYDSEIRSIQAWGLVAVMLILIWVIRRY